MAAASRLFTQVCFPWTLASRFPLGAGRLERLCGGHGRARCRRLRWRVRLADHRTSRDRGQLRHQRLSGVKPTLAPGVRYRFTAWVRSTQSRGIAKLRVTEYLLSTKARLGQVTSFGKRLTPEWQILQVDYTTLSAGSTLDFHVRDFPVVPGEVFLTDLISIHDITGLAGIASADGEVETFPEDATLPLHPVLFPSPIQSSAVLTFATSRPGPLRVEIHDLAGRRVRRLIHDEESQPGTHVLTIQRTGDDGRPLGPGVYFYRIEAAEGVKSGRFVVVR